MSGLYAFAACDNLGHFYDEQAFIHPFVCEVCCRIMCTLQQTCCSDLNPLALLVFCCDCMFSMPAMYVADL